MSNFRICSFRSKEPAHGNRFDKYLVLRKLFRTTVAQKGNEINILYHCIPCVVRCTYMQTALCESGSQMGAAVERIRTGQIPCYEYIPSSTMILQQKMYRYSN